MTTSAPPGLLVPSRRVPDPNGMGHTTRPGPAAAASKQGCGAGRGGFSRCRQWDGYHEQVHDDNITLSAVEAAGER